MVLNPISKLERLDWMVAGRGLRLGKEKRKREARPHSIPSQEPRQTASPLEEGLVFSAPLPSGRH